MCVSWKDDFHHRKKIPLHLQVSLSFLESLAFSWFKIKSGFYALVFEKRAPVNAAGRELWGYRGLLMWESTLRSPFWVSAHHKIHKPLSNFAIRSTMGLLLSKGWDTPFIQVQTQYPLAADDESKREGYYYFYLTYFHHISAKLGMDYKGLNRSAKF